MDVPLGETELLKGAVPERWRPGVALVGSRERALADLLEEIIGSLSFEEVPEAVSRELGRFLTREDRRERQAGVVAMALEGGEPGVAMYGYMKMRAGFLLGYAGVEDASAWIWRCLRRPLRD